MSETGKLLREVARLHDVLQRNSITCCGGTTTAQCHILTELGRSGQMTMAALVRKLALDKGWISRTVEGLAEDGLLIKQPSTTDRRTILLMLTPAGEQRLQELNASLNALSDRVMQRIPSDQHAAVQAALELLNQALLVEIAPPTEIKLIE